MADQHHRRATLNTTVLLATGIALEATIAYRAATQSITYDEAATYLKFLQGSLTDPFRQFDASNHVLFTALARGSIGAFGVSQFSLRLPSVIGAGAFFVALALVCRRVFGFGIMPILAAATVALDPFVLDFMSAARGYGLAFSLLTIALYCLALALDDDPARRPVRWGAASVALGLSVSSQLTFAFPAVGLAVTAALVSVMRDAFGRRSVRDVLWLLGPGAVVVATILVIPLGNAPPSAFNWGAQRLARSVASVMQPVFDHRAPDWACTGPVPSERVPIVAAVICVALTVLIAGALCVVFRRGAEDRPTRSVLARFTLLMAGSLLLTVVQILVSHVALGFRYPEGRTGLYLLLLFPLATSSAVAVLFESPSTKIAGRVGAVLLGLVSVWFVSESTLTYFYEWRFDAGTRRIVEMLVDRAGRSGRPVRVWAEDLEPSISFYRIVEHSDAIGRMPNAGTPPTPSYDFFVACSSSERELTMRLGRSIYVDPVSAAVLIERR